MRFPTKHTEFKYHMLHVQRSIPETCFVYMVWLEHLKQTVLIILHYFNISPC